ncbi:MAG TPA: YqgE/AlgH family protein [Gammaproteobacteria bacterium]|nr:YqgE/AlgH family protein [Gammaproteobacteria bacterium]
MSGSGYLHNQCLIAMPTLADPNFSQTVTYICEHNDEGALGLIINRPSELHLSDIMSQMELEVPVREDLDALLFFGGPVSPERGFVLHPADEGWSATLQVSAEISVTSSRDILSALARGEGPADFLIVLGYAGWGPGQLEQEMLDNAWLSLPADSELLFQTPWERRWEVAAGLLGVDLARLSGQAGHA